MAKQYELTTLKDIFEKVPLDRVEVCMKELTQLMLQCKIIQAGIREAAVGGKEGMAKAFWPEPVTWVDDGKGEITSNVQLNGEHIGKFTTQA